MNPWHKRIAIILGLLLACSVFAGWQYDEFVHERDSAHAALIRQSASVHQALLAGIRSHRRMGRFFEQQLQWVLDDLVETPDVLAVRIEEVDGRVALEAGQVDKLSDSASPTIWKPVGLQLRRELEVRFEPGGGGGGRGPVWSRSEESDGRSRFQVALLMDRAYADAVVQRAARLRFSVACAGMLAIGSVGLAWRAHARSLKADAQSERFSAETERLQELSQAAAGLAHETRNPLGVIRGGLQHFAGDCRLDDSCQEQLHALIEECDRVTARINQFLAYARPREPQLQEVEFSEITAEMRSLLQPDLESAGVALQIIPSDRQRRLLADPDMLRQILFNLIQNAIAFSPRGAAVEVRMADRQAGGAHVDVADRGPGVDPKDANSLFTPYFTTRLGGAGLGLAIVRRLAHAHGWTIDYRERSGGGSIFRIEGVRGAGSS